MRKALLILAVVAAVAATLAAVAQADPRISAAATVDQTTRQVTFSWNAPASGWGGAVCVSTSSAVDATGELLCPVPDLVYDLIPGGSTTLTSEAMDMSITTPTTVYAQVQLIDPFNDGSCTQGLFGANCDSQMIPITVQPICQQVQTAPGYYKTVTVTAGYYKTVTVTRAHYSRKLVKRGHYLRVHGHFVKRHGKRVWVKAKYKRIFHRAVTKQRWVPPVTKQVWVPPTYTTECH